MNRKLIYHLIIGFVLIVAQATCKTSMTLDNYRAYVLNPRNGFLQNAETNRIKYELLYKPLPLVFPKHNISDEQKTDYVDMHYFQLSMSTRSGNEIVELVNNQSDYQLLLQTLQTGIEANTLIITDKGYTLHPVASEYSNLYNHGIRTNVLLVFRNPEIGDSKSFEVRINNLFPVDREEVTFHYNTKQIMKIPELIN